MNNRLIRRKLSGFVLIICALVSSCRCTTPPATPPVPIEPIGKAEWCATIKSIEPDDKWDCMWPPGRIDAADYGTVASPTQDNLVRGGMAASVIVERPSSDIQIGAKRTIQLSAGVGLQLRSLSSWLPDGKINAQTNTSVEISFALRDAKWRLTQGIARTLEPLLQAGDSDAMTTRDTLCRAGTVVAEGVLSGRLIAKVQVTSGSSGVAALGWERVGVNAESVSSTGDSLEVTISNQPIALTRQLSPGADVLALRNLCAPPSPRAMTPTEQRQFTSAVQHMAVGMLETYPCLFMRVGTEVSNNLCGGRPCNSKQVQQHYLRSLGSFSATERQVVCDAVHGLLRPMLSGAVVTMDCTGVTGWFEFFKDERWCVGGVRNGRPGCVGGILATPSMQIGILRDLVQRLAPDEKPLVLDKFAAGWSGIATTTALRTAESDWNSVVTSCEPSGCRVPLNGTNTSTREPWDQVRGRLLGEWLEYFANQPTASFDISCQGAKMCFEQGRWQYKQTGSGSCLSFGGPQKGLPTAAAAFSAQIVRP